jgi:N utilization substance protein B
MQTLFECDFLGRDAAYAQQALLRNREEFAPGTKDASFMQTLLEGVLEKHSELDGIIEKAAPDWPIEKIAPVDRNVLRIGLYELLFADRTHVPAKVAINEAIELAKTFGGENSGRFVNGVLGAVYKEIGEPGKDETTKKKQVDPATLPLELLGGAVVYAHEGEEVYLALVHDIFGHWTLSKGHIDGTNGVENGTKDKLKEELGIDVTIKVPLGENEYIASDPEKGKIRKRVTYFLAEAKFEDLKLKESGGLDDARWFRLRDIVDLNFYDDILPIVTKAVNKLLAGEQK